jgi:hypothetical protein
MEPQMNTDERGWGAGLSSSSSFSFSSSKPPPFLVPKVPLPLPPIRDAARRSQPPLPRHESRVTIHFPLDTPARGE